MFVKNFSFQFHCFFLLSNGVFGLQVALVALARSVSSFTSSFLPSQFGSSTHLTSFWARPDLVVDEEEEEDEEVVVDDEEVVVELEEDELDELLDEPAAAFHSFPAA